MRLGLIPNLRKPEAIAACRDLVAWLEKQEAVPLVEPDVALAMGRPDLSCEEEDFCRAELLVVLGGDGTILRVARAYSHRGLPILGINLGKLGFLAEVERKDMYQGLARVLRGDYTVARRMLLTVTVWRAEELVKTFTALNEAAVSRGAFSRLPEFDIDIDGQALDSLPADGVIIATPTGSTAYSLSAGGPIADPTLEALLFTPICPHVMQSRPLVVSPQSVITVTLKERHESVFLTVDGQEALPLQASDRVVVGRSEATAALVKVSPLGFYHVLRQKLSSPSARPGEENWGC